MSNENKSPIEKKASVYHDRNVQVQVEHSIYTLRDKTRLAVGGKGLAWAAGAADARKNGQMGGLACLGEYT